MHRRLRHDIVRSQQGLLNINQKSQKNNELKVELQIIFKLFPTNKNFLYSSGPLNGRLL
jgi:hypothetical protein